MSKGSMRTIAVLAGAGALVLSAAAPAMAADPITVTSLPGKAKMATTDTVQVRVAAPEGFACGTEGVSWLARVPGKQDAVKLSTTAPCTLDGLAVDVMSNDASKKKNAVVKLVGTNSMTGQKSVMTLVVKVTGKTGNPGKGKKPA